MTCNGLRSCLTAIIIASVGFWLPLAIILWGAL